jgi:hypothetical protein
VARSLGLVLGAQLGVDLGLVRLVIADHLVQQDGRQLEVDWNVGPLSLATRAPWHVLLVARAEVPVAARPSLPADELRAQAQERLVLLWAMAPIASKYIARGQTHRAVQVIGLVRDAYIALWRLLETGHGSVNGLNQPLEPALRQSVPGFGPTIDPPACLATLRQLCDATTRLHARLAVLGVTIPEEMPAQVARLAGDVTG